MLIFSYILYSPGVQRQRHLFLFRPPDRPTVSPRAWWIYAYKLLTARDDIVYNKVLSHMISSLFMLQMMVNDGMMKVLA